MPRVRQPRAPVRPTRDGMGSIVPRGSTLAAVTNRSSQVQYVTDIVALGLNASPVAGASASAGLLGALWWLLASRLSTPDQLGLFVAALGIATLLAEVSHLGVGYVLIR